LTSALVGGEWSASHPGHFTHLRKSPRNPVDKRLGGPQKFSGYFSMQYANKLLKYGHLKKLIHRYRKLKNPISSFLLAKY
jgi:hypothetical protein